MYVITVKFSIQPEQLQAFRSAMLDQARSSLQLESGCLHFDVCQDATDTTQFFLYELYTDKAAFEAHLGSDHFKSFDRHVASWVRSKQVQPYELLETQNV